MGLIIFACLILSGLALVTNPVTSPCFLPQLQPSPVPRPPLPAPLMLRETPLRFSQATAEDTQQLEGKLRLLPQDSAKLPDR